MSALRLSTFLMLILIAPRTLLAGISFYDLNTRVPIKNEYYSVLSVQPGSSPGILKFKVKSDHALYEVEGVVPMIKLLREIEVIEKIRRNEETSGFFDGVAASVGATAGGFVKLVTHPIESGKGLGRAAGKVGRTIGGVFRTKEEGEKTSFGESVLGSSERELAKEFGVDVYTTNPYLKGLLTKMARARMGGKSFVFLATFLIPVGAISLAVTASGLNGAADQVVNDNSRAELFRLNKDALLDLKILNSDAERFLNCPEFSPREATYFRAYLEQLKQVSGFQSLIKIAAQVKTDTDARKILFSTQVAAEEAKKNPKVFGKIEVWGDGLKAQTKDGLIFIMPYDYLDSDSQGKLLLKQMKGELEHSGKSRLELWNAGQVSTGFSGDAKWQGIGLRKLILWGSGKS